MSSENISQADAQADAKRFKYWQWRTIIATMIGYSLFYFVRKNLSMAMPGMEADLGISKAQLGAFLTAHGVIYGVSKFLNGIVGDRVNSRAFMVTGLLLAAACNIIFGFSSSIIVFGVVWMLNGWVQGMGFPPCARLITYWVPPNELATKMAVWNASHSIGAAAVVIFCGYIMAHMGVGENNVGAWRWCFYLPAGVAIMGAIALWFSLRDTPSSVGLPELSGSASEGKTQEDREKESAEFKKFVREKVFFSPVVWAVGLGSFFVYVMRYAVLDWGPTLLSQWKGLSIQSSGWMTAGFEISGIAGMLLTGWVTDRFFGGRGARVCVICMVLATLFVLGFWLLPSSPVVTVGMLMGAGFCIYGPQALNGVIVANIVTRRAAATAIGFTSIFAYASTLISGVGVGLLVDHYGWDHVFAALGGVGVAAVVVYILLWNTKAHGYGEEDKSAS